MKRTGFFASLAALVAGAAITPMLPSATLGMPFLYGDGKHNDGPAIQAAVDGKPVFDTRKNKVVHLLERGKVYLPNVALITSTVILPSNVSVYGVRDA